MISQYSVGFLIPKDASRTLGEDGWEFKSNSRLPEKTESLLKAKLSLNESLSDLSSYSGLGLKVDVFKDEYGEIENVYFRFYDNATPKLPSFLEEVANSNHLEFFIPVNPTASAPLVRKKGAL